MTNAWGAFVLAAFRLVASAQLIDKMLQMRRHARRLRAKDLLETLAHGIANRSASPVIERFDCIFVFAGKAAAFDLPMPEICALGPFTTRSLPPQALSLSWSALVANGMDIDHLQAIHGRALREPVQAERRLIEEMITAELTGAERRQLMSAMAKIYRAATRLASDDEAG